MNIQELQSATEWIRQIDQDFDLDVSGTVLWARFSVSDPSNLKFPDPAIIDCIDIFNADRDYDGESWTPYNEAEPERIAATTCMRYIVMSH